MRNFKHEVRDGQAKLLCGQTSMGKATGFLVESFVRRGVAELEGAAFARSVRLSTAADLAALVTSAGGEPATAAEAHLLRALAHEVRSRRCPFAAAAASVARDALPSTRSTRYSARGCARCARGCSKTALWLRRMWTCRRTCSLQRFKPRSLHCSALRPRITTEAMRARRRLLLRAAKSTQNLRLQMPMTRMATKMATRKTTATPTGVPAARAGGATRAMCLQHMLRRWRRPPAPRRCLPLLRLCCASTPCRLPPAWRSVRSAGCWKSTAPAASGLGAPRAQRSRVRWPRWRRSKQASKVSLRLCAAPRVHS